MTMILTERNSTHGSYQLNAEISQSLKAVCQGLGHWEDLPDDVRESIDMICLKLSRILSGKHDHADHWVDISGYSSLILKQIKGEELQGTLYYLATPYSKYRFGLEAAFKEAAILQARLVKYGLDVYSPIVSSHPIAIHGSIDPLDHSFWLPFNQPMMDRCEALLVAHMEGWEDSRGIKHEIDDFTKRGRQIFDINIETLEMTRRA